MEISLKGFRSHINSHYLFPENLSTYIHGPNGSGKSDIYRAIRWSLFPKKSDKVHPIFSTSSYVEVIIKFAGIKIKRTCSPNTVCINTDKGKYLGLDAEEVIKNIFGNYKLWKLCSHLESNKHPFMSSNSSQRIEIMNDIVSFDEDMRKKIATIITESKADMKLFQQQYDKENIKFGVEYEGLELNKNLIMTKPEVVQTRKNIDCMSFDLSKMIENLSMLSVLNSRLNKINQLIKNLSKYSDEGLENLRINRNKCLIYLPLKNEIKRLDNLFKNINISVDDALNLHLTQKDIDNCLVIMKTRETYAKKCLSIGIDYSEESIKNALRVSNSILAMEANIISLQKYEKIVSECNVLFSKISRAQAEPFSEIYSDCNNGTKATILESIKNAEKMLADAEEQLSYTELCLSYASAFEKNESIKSLEKEISDIFSKLKIQDAEEYILTMEEHLKDQEVYLRRDEFEEIYKKLSYGKKIPSNPSDFIAIKLEESIKEIGNIEMSKKTVKCPYCLSNIICGPDGLKKYEGEYIDNSKINTLENTLRSDIAYLKTLSKMRYPSIRDGASRKNIINIKDNIALANKAIILNGRFIKKKKKAVAIPDNVQKINSLDAKHSIAKLKSLIINLNSFINLAKKLSSMEKPDIILNPKITIEEAKKIISELQYIKYIEEPRYSPSQMRIIIEYLECVEKLSHTEVPDLIVSEEDIISYSSKLNNLNELKIEINKIENKKVLIDASQEKAEDLKNKIAELNKNLELHVKHSKMRKDSKSLKKFQKHLDKKIKYYDSSVEFLEIFEDSSKKCCSNIINSIQRDANLFLSSIESMIRINISYTDKITISCTKNGTEIGKISELSEGEQSLVSFSISIAFCLKSRNNIVIMDEITDKISVENKDKCIERMLEIFKQNNKLLLITDHSCSSGDYDNSIELS
jgi:hypothetical protein